MHTRLMYPLVVLILGFATHAIAQEIAPPKTLDEALASQFKCPTGTHDSGMGPSPGIVVRWCDVERGGRLLYHGPLWRWYRSGELEGKEYYVNGDAAGVWPSYYENGNMSSLGNFEGGAKRGLWKYWNENGKLKTEVTYLDDGNVRNDYYTSGRKKATGVFMRTGKIGKWIYWKEDGSEIARCDFGKGVFAPPNEFCKIIAEQLDPKGHSLPIPVGASTGDGEFSVAVESELFTFGTPDKWIPDVVAGRQDDLPIVLYPHGKQWKAAGANMYIRVCFKRGRSLETTIKDDKEDFADNVADYREESDNKGLLSVGHEYTLSSITYRPLTETDSPFSIVGSNKVHERIAYVNGSKEVVLLLVLTADSDEDLQQALPAFNKLLESFHSGLVK